MLPRYTYIAVGILQFNTEKKTFNEIGIQCQCRKSITILKFGDKEHNKHLNILTTFVSHIVEGTSILLALIYSLKQKCNIES